MGLMLSVDQQVVSSFHLRSQVVFAPEMTQPLDVPNLLNIVGMPCRTC